MKAKTQNNYEDEIKEQRRRARLFPTSKFNWRAAPLLIRYRPEHYEKILDRNNVREDERTVHSILMHYCDCGPKGKPAASWNCYGNYLKLRDGRMIDLSDIIDAIGDSAERQKQRVEEFLAKASIG